MDLTRFPRPERLTVRLAVGIALLVITPLSAVLYLLARRQLEQTIAARLTAAELETRMLEAALRHQMIRRDNRLMTEILEEVGRQPEVQRAMILDHDGVVRMSSRGPEVGVRIPRDSPTCLVCHSKTPGARERWVLFQEGGTEVLRSVLPIVNRPAGIGTRVNFTIVPGIVCSYISREQRFLRAAAITLRDMALWSWCESWSQCV